MKRTYDFSLNEFKGNIRGNYIREPFTTFEELLVTLPDSIGASIEISKSSLTFLCGLHPRLTDHCVRVPYAVRDI